jgi:hypothetical protein
MMESVQCLEAIWVERTLNWAWFQRSGIFQVRSKCIVLCLYESGTLNGKEGNVAHITLARFGFSWLQDAR